MRIPTIIGGLVLAVSLMPIADTAVQAQAAQSPGSTIAADAKSPTETLAAVFDAVRNAGDVDSAMSLFTPEARVKIPPDLYSTPQQIRDWLHYLADNHFTVEPSAHNVSGNRAIWQVEMTSDYLQLLNLGSLRGTATMDVDGGHIVAYTMVLDATSTHRLREAQLAALEVLQNPVIVGLDSANIYGPSDVFRDSAGNLVSFRDLITAEPGTGPFVDLWGEPIIIRSGI
jgi:SnoaL-like domain